jgi:hypothetical protein
VFVSTTAELAVFVLPLTVAAFFGVSVVAQPFRKIKAVIKIKVLLKVIYNLRFIKKSKEKV